jgi:predicted phosphodiesterase
VRVAVLNDVHGNLPALEAVLAEVPGDAAIVFGGDIVAGPSPRETLERVQALGDRARCLRGNADHEDGAQDGLALRRRRWVFEQLDEAQRRFLVELPPTLRLEIDGLGPTLFCHGSPRDENEIITAVTSEKRLRRILAGTRERTVVCGHTHHQFDRRVDGIRILNAGSVGMPYEGTCGAFWALLGAGVELRATEYDVEAAVEAMRTGGYPEPEEEAAAYLLDPPEPLAVAEYFEQLALEQVRS